jgi:hypothetical protein
VNAVGVARLGVGVAELVAPGRLGSAALGHTPDRRERMVVRALGARRLGQEVAAWRGDDLLAGPLLDVLHAASMVGLATFSRRYRRGALVSAVTASAFALAAARF